MFRIHDLQTVKVKSRINDNNFWSSGYMGKKMGEERTIKCSISIPEPSLMKPIVDRNQNYSRFQEFLIFRTTDEDVYLEDIIIYNNDEYEIMTIEERNKMYSKYINSKTIYAGKVERNV
jgi:hypothetical protein